MSLIHDFVHDVRNVNRHLGRLGFLIETAQLLPYERQAIMAAIDTLTTSVGNLETAASAAVAEIATLTAAENEAALTALAGRIDTVASNLTSAVPAPAPALAPATPPAA